MRESRPGGRRPPDLLADPPARAAGWKGGRPCLTDPQLPDASSMAHTRDRARVGDVTTEP